jgi:Predicted nucleic-acid-binding protein implicated in transcription termination
MRADRADSERSCIVTRAAQSPEGLIRFVVDPDGRVVPDVREKLPGRGAWVGARRELVETAAAKRLFNRAFRGEVVVPPDLAGLVDRLLEEAALSSLSIARKAGAAVTGAFKVVEAVEAGKAIAVVHAREAAGDGRRKIAQAVRRTAVAAAEEGVAVPAVRTIEGIFSVEQMDLAFGGANVIHAALLAGGASRSCLNRIDALARYRGLERTGTEGLPPEGDAGEHSGPL